jgi:ubiquinone biosynthesis protein
VRDAGALPRPAGWRVALRGLRWGLAGGWVLTGEAADRALGRASPERLGRRLRLALTWIGGTAVKLGQQLSVRADLLVPEICAELAALSDRAPPMAWARVRPLLAAEFGRPVDEVLAELDPVPIGSASVATVYRARLRDGRAVAVKVRRPGIRERFAADLAVLGGVLWALEAATLFRDGSFGPLRRDLEGMLGEETSFRLEARYQRLFRRAVRRAGMNGWVDAPEVVSALSGDEVLVTAFVDALPLSVALAAREGDPVAAARVAAAGVDVGALARRFARMSLWVRFEAPFFHADPHPGNVMVEPGGRIVLLDFGACGTTSTRMRRDQIEVLRLLIDGDVSAATRVALSNIAPLPHLDLDAFEGEARRSFGALLRAIHDRDAPWQERIFVAVWLRLLELTRRYQIRVNLDTVRSIRAFLLYDTLAVRLDPELGMGPSRRYLRDVARRRAGAVRERGLGGIEVGVAVGRAARAAEAAAPRLEAVRGLHAGAQRARIAVARGLARGVGCGVGILAIDAALRLGGGGFGWAPAAAVAVAGLAAAGPAVRAARWLERGGTG